MTRFTKAIAGTVAAGAMAVTAVSPAAAQSYRHHNDGISTGEVIAGALIIGGIAAIAASADNDGYRYGNRYPSPRNYGNPRQAVDQCVRVAERNAGRLRGDVTDVRQVRETRWGYEVRGRIAVKTYQGNWRGRGNYGNGWGGDYRGWERSMRGYDAGTFACRFERGRVVDIDYNGIRGL